MKAPSLLFALALMTMACRAAEPGEPPPISTSIAELKTMLAAPLTRVELERKFGRCLHAGGDTYGNLIYKCDSGAYAVFSFKGPHITGASMGSEKIEGIAPKSFAITLSFDRDKKECSPCLNGEVFQNLDQFTKIIKDLPAGSVLEWPGSCDATTPLQTGKKLQEIRAAAESAGITLILYPAG